MAFTRKFLTALGIEPDKVDEIMSAHVEVTDALKAQINDSKDEADKLTKVQAELDKLKASQKEQAERLSAAEKERDEIKGKYDTASADLEKIKTENAERETEERSKKILADYLKEQKFSASAIRLITNKGGFHKSIEFDDEGKAKNLGDIRQSILADEDFSVFTPKETKTDHVPATPPANAGGKKSMTKADIMAIKDDAERQQAIKDNLSEFGISEEP